jgi:mono/diheme cytochrome c family protein
VEVMGALRGPSLRGGPVKKPSFQVRAMREGHAVDEYWDTDREYPRCTVWASTQASRIEAEAVAAALQGTIERFIQANKEQEDATPS